MKEHLVRKPVKTLLVIILMFFLVSTVSYAVNFDNRKNVLILTSYHEGFTWTQEITGGILDVLKKSDYIIDASVEYMDWKNYPTTENLEMLTALYRQKYQSKKIDIIITVDDAAFKYALEHRAELFSDAPVVFCGVNEVGLSDIASGYRNYTGIMERVDPGDTVKLAINAMPNLKRIYLIYDNTESGLSSGLIALDALKELRPDIEGLSINNVTYVQVREEVGKIQGDSAIFILSFYVDAAGDTMGFEDFCKMVSSVSSVPVFNLYDFTIGHGAIGGSMLSGRMQGEYAAEIALSVLGGKPADEIPISTKKTVREIYDYNQLVRFGIPLDRVDESGEIINKPFSFFETYKTLVLAATGIFVALSGLIVVLVVYNRKLRAAERKLQESYDELESTYEELFATQGELSVKYEEMKDYQKKLRRSAYQDALTGFPNRLSLYEKLTDYFRKRPNGRMALIYVDSDNFKFVNDTMGHSVGDKFIIEISKRLSDLLNEKQTIFRLGGDEFIICFSDFESIKEIEDFAQVILDCFSNPFEVENSQVYITASIGISYYPEHGSTAEELYQHADIAMYQAKSSGKSRRVIYDHNLQALVSERMSIERNLRSALANNEFLLHFQPQLDIISGKITGFEALLRWSNPELGMVPPVKFIGIAEETHMIIPIGEWVLKNACLFLRQLHDKGFRDLTMAVNISILQLLQENFTDMVLDILRTLDLKPQSLELEVTESILMQSYMNICDKLLILREAGVRIALDDFGQGYSSLSHLRQLPIHTLKIDKSFIDSINSKNPKDNFIDTIVLIGRKMGLDVLAEGVENQEQLDFLIRHKCNKVQGYLISKPIPREDALKFYMEFNSPIAREASNE